MADPALTLEKLKIDERLATVEKHMTEGTENRKSLMEGFEKLKLSVETMETTLFGKKGELGVVQRMDAVLQVADGIKWVLTKIFLAICTALVLYCAPSILRYAAEALTKHTGG